MVYCTHRQGTVRTADAAAIAADVATACSCDTPFPQKEDIRNAAAVMAAVFSFPDIL